MCRARRGVVHFVRRAPGPTRLPAHPSGAADAAPRSPPRSSRKTLSAVIGRTSMIELRSTPREATASSTFSRCAQMAATAGSWASALRHSLNAQPAHPYGAPPGGSSRLSRRSQPTRAIRSAQRRVGAATRTCGLPWPTVLARGSSPMSPPTKTTARSSRNSRPMVDCWSGPNAQRPGECSTQTASRGSGDETPELRQRDRPRFTHLPRLVTIRTCARILFGERSHQTGW